MKLPQITIDRFFLLGIILYGIITWADAFNKVIFWSTFNLFSKISAIAGILMNLITILFFYFMYGQTKPTELDQVQADDLKDVFADMEKKNA